LSLEFRVSAFAKATADKSDFVEDEDEDEHEDELSIHQPLASFLKGV
jgi:hypothetical protein